MVKIISLYCEWLQICNQGKCFKRSYPIILSYLWVFWPYWFGDRKGMWPTKLLRTVLLSNTRLTCTGYWTVSWLNTTKT